MFYFNELGISGIHGNTSTEANKIANKGYGPRFPEVPDYATNNNLKVFGKSEVIPDWRFFWF